MKNMKKILFISVLTLFLFIPLLNTASAQMIDNSEMENQANAFNSKAEFGDMTIGVVVATVIKGFLSFLGVIFIILIIYGGFRWMTAQGNEDQVTEAKKNIRNAVIGIIIIMAAYAITFFVFEALNQASSPDGVGNRGGL
jgi:amino acid transporter